MADPLLLQVAITAGVTAGVVVCVKILNDRHRKKRVSQHRIAVRTSTPLSVVKETPSPRGASSIGRRGGRIRWRDPYTEVARGDDLLGAVTDVKYEGDICDLFVTERGVGVVNLLSLPRLDRAEMEMLDPDTAREVARRRVVLTEAEELLQHGDFRPLGELRRVTFPARSLVVFEWSDGEWRIELPPGGAGYLLEVLRRGPYGPLIDEGALRGRGTLLRAPALFPGEVGEASRPEGTVSDLGTPSSELLEEAPFKIARLNESALRLKVRREDNSVKIECPGCGSYVDISWDRCPNCGEDLRPLKALYEKERPVFTALEHSRERLRREYGSEGTFNMKVKSFGGGTLIMCPGCGRYVDISQNRCPKCGKDLRSLRAMYEERIAFLNEILRKHEESRRPSPPP